MPREKHNPEGINKEEPKNSVLDYLAEKNKTLVKDYRTPDDNYSESCSLIAKNIAKTLVKEGKKPRIISVTGKRIPNSSNRESLQPVQYAGRVSWGAHVVCVCDGLVYDPMIGRPLPLEEYAHEAFGCDVEIETLISEDEIEEFVNK
jgi:hypothetical protein